MNFMTQHGAHIDISALLSLNARTSSLATYGLLYPIPHILSAIPFLSIVLLLITLYTFYKYFFEKVFSLNAAISFRSISYLCASLTALSVLILVPGLYTNLFWFSALPVHFWSYCLLTIFVVCLLRTYDTERNSKPRSLILPAFALVIGLFYETTAILMLLAVLLILLYSVHHRKRKPRKVLVSCFVISILSVCWLAFSPGVQSRLNSQAKYSVSSTHQVNGPVGQVLTHNIFHTVPELFTRSEILLVVFLGSYLLSQGYLKAIKISRKQSMLFLLCVTAASLLIPLLNTAVVWYGTHTNPPLRAYFVNAYLYSLAAVVVGIVAGQIIRPPDRYWRGFFAAASLSVITLVLLSASFYIPYLRNFRGVTKIHAIAWDKRDAQIKQRISNGGCVMHVASLPIEGVGDIDTNRASWRNGMITHYYFGSNPGHCVIYAKRWVPWFQSD